MVNNKKKKATRACFSCQKAHLTCDDDRPCNRCVKRGLADQCKDGHRKKPKYIMDDQFQSNSANSEYNVLNELLGSMEPANTRRDQLASINLQPINQSIENLDVYNQVNQRYPYELGYKHLLNYLKFNNQFSQLEKLNVFKALAEFRPSLLSLQLNLNEQDEIFAEKSFKRSILDIDNLIKSISAPTVVWRRTGEISLVGDEFHYITGYDKNLLLNKPTWQQFSKHAFDSTSPTVNSHCILKHANGSPVPCTFSFTIRKDIFDIPSYVIGTWLPILPHEPDESDDIKFESDEYEIDQDIEDKFIDQQSFIEPNAIYQNDRV
ncbi:hypothetical protein E3Q00_01236 [Wallemia mellicola]|nr:hypothetical protein E3Q00_01236 [Wallemia mellicola]